MFISLFFSVALRIFVAFSLKLIHGGGRCMYMVFLVLQSPHTQPKQICAEYQCLSHPLLLALTVFRGVLLLS